jgi:hypothetical protein
MDVTTNRKGALAEAAIVKEAVRLGMDVYRRSSRAAATTSSSTQGDPCFGHSASGRVAKGM